MTYARFNPSPYSYGDEAPPVVEEPPKGGSTDYLNVVLPIAKSLLGIGEVDDPDLIRAKIENLQGQMAKALPSPAGIPIPGTKQFYANEINKLQAKLVEAERTLALETQNQQLYTAMKVGGVVAVFTGVLLLGGFALNQIQKARRQQAEIEHLQMGNAHA
jgi:hypothetical protein